MDTAKASLRVPRQSSTLLRSRGLGRSADRDDSNVHEWQLLDLSRELDPAALAGAEVVVQAAGEVSGGFDAYQRNSVDATRNLLAATSRAGARRLVYISSVSVLRPPRTPWERQDENTPLAPNPWPLGAYYTWGKILAETVVAREAEPASIATRIIRPAALLDLDNIKFPVFLGRRLYGRWYLDLGCPGLPLAVCDVAVAGDVIAWYAARFEEAPRVLNLMDLRLMTRREVLRAFRERGWNGHVLWTPISLMAGVIRDTEDGAYAQPICLAPATCGVVRAQAQALYPGPFGGSTRHRCERPRARRGSRRLPGASGHRRNWMIAFSFLLAAGAFVLLLPSLSDLLSLARIALGRQTQRTRARELPRLLFLVPAHNEELLIEQCVRSLLNVRYPRERIRLVVIADNCADMTARRARAAGAECMERADAERRGKPHAIAWALERLGVRDYDAVVIIDADTVVDPGFAAALGEVAPLAGKAVQSYFDVSNRTENALTRMAAVLGASIHRFAYPLKQRAGLNVPLVGNGMCIGAEVLATHGWTAFSICEDWELYALLTTQGVRIESQPQARLYAQEARSLRQSLSQRQRWTAGKLTVLAQHGWTLARSTRIGLRQKLDSLAELAAPGPVVHAGLVVTAILGDALLRPPGAIWLPLALVASLIRTGAYTIAALRVEPEPRRAILAFALLPLYAVWRMGAAATALTKLGAKPWVRTERHPPQGSERER